MDEIKESKGVKYDTDLTADDMKEIVVRFKADLQGEDGRRVPAGPEGSAHGGHQGRFPLLG